VGKLDDAEADVTLALRLDAELYKSCDCFRYAKRRSLGPAAPGLVRKLFACRAFVFR
jgi:hypothetical protein